MARHARWLFAMLAGALAGCVSLPKPELDVALPAQWQNVPGLPSATETDMHSWWRAFGDQQLDSLVDQALAANLDVQAATARWRAARTLHAHSGDSLLPTLHAKTTDAIDPDASAAFFIAGFDAVWEFGLFGRHAAAERVAHGNMDHAAADADAARLSLVAEVVRDWIELRGAQDREALLAQVSEARQRQAQLMGVRASLALASKLQLAQADAAAAQARAALSSPQQEIVAAAQNLAALLGRAEPDRAWLQAAPLPQLGEWRVSSVPADLLRARPDIARSQADILRVSGELGLAKADQYPSIGLGGSLHWSTSTTAHRQTRPNEAIGVLGPVVDIPLFDWGLRHAVASAKADELRAAAFAYRNTVLVAVAEAETAMSAVERQREREANSLVAWRSLGETAQGTAERNRLGLASDIDRLESDVDRDQSALLLAEARSEHDLAYVALCKALGGAPPDPSVTETR